MSVSILQGTISIIDNADTSKAEVGNLNISKYLVAGTTGSFGTSVSVGTTLTVGALLSAANVTLSSSSATNTIAGPLALQAPTTSSSTGTFTTLTTTSSSAANTFSNPSTFSALISGNAANFTNTVTASNFNASSTTLVSTFQGPLTVQGVASFNNTTDSATSTTLSSINTLGGLSVVKSANIGTTLGVLGMSTFGARINYPNTFYSITAQSSLAVAQGGLGVLGNVWRFRTNDTTNTAVRMSIGNAGLGASFYDSNFSVYGLGVIEGTTGNTERLSLGYNGSSGPYINQIYTGTGIARPLNIYNGALFTAGGALSLASSLTVASTSLLTGAVTASTTLSVLGQTTFGAQCNYPNSYYTYTANLSGTGNTFRFRSTDATNTGVINSVANTGVSATTSYLSLMAFYSLGNTELNTTNTELMSIGCTGTGAFITPSSAGTGVTTKPINIYGATLINNGLVTLPAGLTVTSGTTTLGGILNLTSTTDLTSFTLAGGASITKSLSMGGGLKLGTNSASITAASNPLASTMGVLLTASTVTWNDTSTAASTTAAGNFYGTYLGISTLTATNTSITTPIASTLYVASAPVASTNQTITSAYSAYFASGNVYMGSSTQSTTSSTGALVVAGGGGFGGNVVVGGVMACSSIQNYGTLSVQGATTLGSTLNLPYLSTQPTTPTAGETFFMNTAGLLSSVGTDGMLTTYQPLTTVGDLLVYNGTTQTRLAKGTDATVLIADSTATVGVSWQSNSRMLVYNGNTATVAATKWAVKFFTGTSASNTGQILIYPTSTALSTGAKIFSTIVHVSVYVQGNTGGTNAYNMIWGVVNSQSTTVIDVRIVQGTNELVLNPTPQFYAGQSATIRVEGIPL